MNQRELIEIHSHIMNMGWKIQATQSDEIWLYSFTKNAGKDIYQISLVQVGSGYKVATTKNAIECNGLANTFSSYDDSLLAMAEECYRIESDI